MDKFFEIIAKIGDFLWNWPLIVLLFATSIYLLIGTRAFQFRRFGHIMKSTFGKIKEKGEGNSLSPFMAACIALANTIGTGNIAGVASAIAVGGPGAVFWMELMALLGMLTKTCEVTLAVHYRGIDPDGKPFGSPMAYMKKGLGLGWLAKLFAVALVINAFLTNGLVQPNTVATAFNEYYGINPYIVAAVLAIVCGVVMFGGIKKIGQACNIMVPVMSIFYIVFGLLVIILNAKNIPGALGLIFGYAFKPMAAVGGFAGSVVASTLKKGLSRGMYSNEAGQGTAPIAHAFAKTGHPVEQGMWGAFEVFVDTTIVCTMTALIIMTTGVWQGDKSGITMVLSAFDQTFNGTFASMVMCITVFFFCFSCYLGFAATGIMATEYLFPKHRKTASTVFKILYMIPCIVFAGQSDFNQVSALADVVTGLEAWPNLIALLLLAPVFFELVRDYESGEYKYATEKTDKEQRFIKESKEYKAEMDAKK